jgi:uncharacterized membrane protein YebE (DUF533 family)
MDAVKILGGLLSQRAARTGGAGQVLGQVLNGIAAAKEQKERQQHMDARFDHHRHHSPLEGLVRDSVSRHHHGGGQLPPHVSNWAQQHGPRYRTQHQRVETVRRAPEPRHDVRDHHQHEHGSGLGYHQRAELLIQAMIMAAQADGKIDSVEQDRIVQQLQPLDRAESDFLRREFGRRHDVHAFVHALPLGMEYEVYQISLMAMDLDTRKEADYMRALAKCLRIEPQICNNLHRQFGAPNLY